MLHKNARSSFTWSKVIWIITEAAPCCCSEGTEPCDWPRANKLELQEGGYLQVILLTSSNNPKETMLRAMRTKISKCMVTKLIMPNSTGSHVHVKIFQEILGNMTLKGKLILTQNRFWNPCIFFPTICISCECLKTPHRGGGSWSRPRALDGMSVLHLQASLFAQWWR